MFTFYYSVNYIMRVFLLLGCLSTLDECVRVPLCMQCSHAHIQAGKNRTIRFFWYVIESYTNTYTRTHKFNTCMHGKPSHVRLAMHMHTSTSIYDLYTYMGVIRFHDIITNDQYKFCTVCQIVAFCLRHSHVKVVYFVAIDTYILVCSLHFSDFFFE